MNVHTRLRRNLSAGYTLIEVIAVIVIVGVLAAIAAPSWLRYINNQRIGAVQSDLVQTLQQAQQRAIQRRQTVQVTVNETASRPTITVDPPISADAGGAIVLGEGDAVRPNIITLDAFSAAGDDTVDVCFDYQGAMSLDLNDQQTGGCGDEAAPFVVNITARGAGRQQCVIVASLVGTIKTAQGADCDSPTVDPS